MGIDQPVGINASQPGQRRIGVTGGIATGKSSVGRLLASSHGLPVLDADVFARDALAGGSAAAQAVADHFGPQVVQANAGGKGDLTLDRTALGRIIFADAGARAWLEQLVHPLVRARFVEALNTLQEQPVVVLIIPLLFEAGLEGLCSEIWLVDCEDAQQLARLMERNGFNEAEARARIKAQWPLARKRQLADVLIDNRGAPEALAQQVAAALSP